MASSPKVYWSRPAVRRALAALRVDRRPARPGECIVCHRPLQTDGDDLVCPTCGARYVGAVGAEAERPPGRVADTVIDGLLRRARKGDDHGDE